MKLALAGLVLSLAASWGHADSVVRSDHPDTYTVVRGDTLWDISGRFLSSPWLWPEIWQANPGIANPHLIYPGDTVRLVYIDGQPRLIVDRNRIVKLSPKARPEPLSGAIPTLPIEIIGPYLNDNQMVAMGELDSAPYILAEQDGRMLSTDGDVAYARGEAIFGLSEYGVFREGRSFVDPETGEVLGVEAVSVADANVQSRRDALTRVVLSDSNREVRSGDRLLPRPAELTSDFIPSAAPEGVAGEILAVVDGVQQVGQYDVVILNVGSEEQVQPGNVFGVMREGRRVADPVSGEAVTLPSERSGLLMVFRTFDQLSYGLVVQADRAMRVGDTIELP